LQNKTEKLHHTLSRAVIPLFAKTSWVPIETKELQGSDPVMSDSATKIQIWNGVSLGSHPVCDIAVQCVPALHSLHKLAILSALVLAPGIQRFFNIGNIAVIVKSLEL
jgi:hypothetical protein